MSHTKKEKNMETSQTLKEFAVAFAKCQGELKNAPKNSENPYFKNKYADLTTIIDTAKPILSKYGFSILQGLSSEGKTAIITTLLLHVSGEFVKDSLKLEAKDSSPQALGSAFTYGKRYAYSSILGMATDDDDDGNGAQQEEKKLLQEKKEPEKTNKKPVPSEILAIQKEVNRLMNEAGIKMENRKTKILELQKTFGIKGKIEDFSERDWTIILGYFQEK